MASQISNLAFGGLLVASLPPLYLFVTSSRLLLQYEDLTKKAAKFSSEAGRQLRKTRTTQGSAVVASVISTVSAVYALIFTDSSGALSVINALTSLAAASYVGGFWKGATKTPPGLGGREYNDAIRATEQGLRWLNRLGLSWGIVSIGRFVFGFLSR